MIILNVFWLASLQTLMPVLESIFLSPETIDCRTYWYFALVRFWIAVAYIFVHQCAAAAVHQLAVIDCGSHVILVWIGDVTTLLS